MTDNETMKSADNETVKQRIKAIYPHITVSGTVDKPYYNIDWYDIEKQTMYRGWFSYNLELVRKWLEEEFEAVEADIDDLINRQKAEIEQLEKDKESFANSYAKAIARNLTIKAEAVKEFAERLKEKAVDVGICDAQGNGYGGATVILIGDIDNLVKEMVGAENG